MLPAAWEVKGQVGATVKGDYRGRGCPGQPQYYGPKQYRHATGAEGSGNVGACLTSRRDPFALLLMPELGRTRGYVQQ
jgi:hypothetical protein